MTVEESNIVQYSSFLDHGAVSTAMLLVKQQFFLTRQHTILQERAKP
jgi:hypothetical protein